MNYSHEVENMCIVTKGPHHGPAPIPEEGKWVKSTQITDISGLSHGIGWCAPQQGAVQRDQGHLRSDPRRRLVRSSAGCM